MKAGNGGAGVKNKVGGGLSLSWVIAGDGKTGSARHTQARGLAER